MTSTFFEKSPVNIDPKLAEMIAAEIEATENELLQQVQSQVQLVKKVGLHTLQAGGKRLRPAFVVFSAKVIDENHDVSRTRKLGACMEMIHMATLIHDDVIDHAATRRGHKTASSVFGNTPSILTGDVLLSKAMTILAQDGDLNIIRAVSQSVVEMAEGEVLELETRDRFELDIEQHLRILRMKTGSFIECCCAVGGHAAGASEEARAALQKYGYHVGLAFQIVDDILDYRGDKQKTGKPKATDFREGCATLPLIYLRETLSEADEAFVRSKFGGEATDEDIERVSALMAKTGVFDRVEVEANMHVDNALESLKALPESSYRNLLELVGHFVVSRQM